MTDTLIAAPGVIADTTGRYRLTRAAVEHAKTKHGLANDAAVWTAMGLSRSTFYRMLAGTSSPTGRLICQGFATWIGWPLADTCEPVTDEAPNGH
ncbi:hypothetical protein [Micromonospora pisi]|nr:hypothetical protein [Micromonospora pisi]